VIAYVGLGANLGEREATLLRALELLREEPGVDVVAVSRIRETEPVGYEDQPKFLNAAARVETTLRPRALLDRLLDIERQLGRTRTRRRFGPRTIDLDLLVYGNESVAEPGLTVPHPRVQERRFVLEPLAELDPTLEIRGMGNVSELLSKLE
jgi:2-amino-4-hydroxy-6-hydroxymethyldihydropteridine diphosphokinase